MLVILLMIDSCYSRLRGFCIAETDDSLGNPSPRAPDRLDVSRFIRFDRCLPQDFAKFFPGRCHVALCGTGDADRH